MEYETLEGNGKHKVLMNLKLSESPPYKARSCSGASGSLHIMWPIFPSYTPSAPIRAALRCTLLVRCYDEHAAQGDMKMRVNIDETGKRIIDLILSECKACIYQCDKPWKTKTDVVKSALIKFSTMECFAFKELKVPSTTKGGE